MRILNEFGHLTQELWMLVRQAPWLPSAAIAGEAIQHIVEYQLGMYVSQDGISPGIEANVRMSAAAIKVIGFIVTVIATRLAARKFQDVLGQASRLPGLPAALAAVLLPIAVHYALNFLAVGRAPTVVIAIIVIDTLVIGWLAMTIAIGLPRSNPDGLR